MTSICPRRLTERLGQITEDLMREVAAALRRLLGF
jgi:mRNA-degrading endonuclease toxin of MazEF toxin-antitoxin module